MIAYRITVPERAAISIPADRVRHRIEHDLVRLPGNFLRGQVHGHDARPQHDSIGSIRSTLWNFLRIGPRVNRCGLSRKGVETLGPYEAEIIDVPGAHDHIRLRATHRALILKRPIVCLIACCLYW